MRSITFIITIIFVFLFGVTAYLAFQNRNSEALRSKVMPAIAIAVVGALFTIWFSLKSENIELKFTSTLFFHKLDKRPLDDHLDSLHDGRLKLGGYQFTNELPKFIRDHLEKDSGLNKAKFNENSEEIKEFYHNMLLIKLIHHFYWMYSGRWDITVDSVRRGTGMLSSSQSVSEKPEPNDSLKWKDLLSTKQQNSFYNLLTDFSGVAIGKEMKVPPETKVNFIITEYKKKIILKNPFVEVSVTIDKHSGSTGLGDYQWLLGYDNKRNEEFWSEHFKVSCRAEFEKFKSGHPEMPKYERWVKTMFAEVQYQLDEKEQLKRAREYRDLVGPYDKRDYSKN